MRRTLPVLVMIMMLAAPLAGCSDKPASSAAPGASSTPTADPTGDDPSADPTASLDGGEPVPDASSAAAEVAKTEVGRLMAKLGCTQPQIVETDPLSLQTGMCELSGDVIVATFATAAKRDDWAHQSTVSGLAVVEGPLWAAGVEVDTDTPTVVTKLGGTATP